MFSYIRIQEDFVFPVVNFDEKLCDITNFLDGQDHGVMNNYQRNNRWKLYDRKKGYTKML